MNVADSADKIVSYCSALEISMRLDSNDICLYRTPYIVSYISEDSQCFKGLFEDFYLKTSIATGVVHHTGIVRVLASLAVVVHRIGDRRVSRNLIESKNKTKHHNRALNGMA